MKLIDYDKHKTEIRKKIAEISFDPKITIRESIDRIMELLENLPADYNEKQVEKIDQAYRKVCMDLEKAKREAADTATVVYYAIHKTITNRIDQIQALLIQYPDAATGMMGRLDELNMALAACEKWHREYMEKVKRRGM